MVRSSDDLGEQSGTEPPVAESSEEREPQRESLPLSSLRRDF